MGAIIAFYVGPTSSTAYSYVFDFISLGFDFISPGFDFIFPMASTSFSYGFPSMFLRLRPHVVFHIPLSGRGNIAGEYVQSFCMPSPLTMFLVVST